jgi:hypothetical protein
MLKSPDLNKKSELRKETIENFLEKNKETLAEFEKSEYWNKNFPGVDGYTIGDSITLLARYEELKLDIHNPEKVYKDELSKI